MDDPLESRDYHLVVMRNMETMAYNTRDIPDIYVISSVSSSNR